MHFPLHVFYFFNIAQFSLLKCLTNIYIYNDQVIRMVGESGEAVSATVGGGSSGNKMPTLEEYGTNLTKLAEEVVWFFSRWILLIIGRWF